MNMDFGLFQQQKLKLVMTNELRQAITILQYSTLDLLDYIQEQAIENPLMELSDSTGNEEQWEKSSIEDWEPNLDSKPYEGDPTYSPLDHISKNEDGLQDYLLNQIRFLQIKDIERKTMMYLALNLNDHGYFVRDVHDIALELNVDVSVVETSLMRLQMLEPAGVGARNLQECLLIQLNDLESRDVLAETIVEQYLDLFAEKKWKQIAKELSVTVQDIQAVSDLLQTLEPKPGACFGGDPSKYLIPDVTIEQVEDEYFVIVNDSLLPRIQLNTQYRSLLKQNEETDASKFVHQKYQQMMWLLKSIDQRRVTLMKVTEAIVRHQKDFFDHGPNHLKPLTLKEIAEEVEVHESTVSRATNQKYVQTPRGLYELKYFFTSSLSTEDGEQTSSNSVKESIKALIEQENKEKPLSDQKIVTLLKDQGIVVSRRTIAKYRDEMRIPSSAKRKRYG
ncbi:RNA polymerase factor sigma-54 [Anaerobacillus sp. MEB173]|uniref:RNA polymerase factor sigma-54 n=1 Tax=Anaerobacillus sp. MEB173 TaxID=3383345 RepID=UPI003F91E40B